MATTDGPLGCNFAMDLEIDRATAIYLRVEPLGRQYLLPVNLPISLRARLGLGEVPFVEYREDEIVLWASVEDLWLLCDGNDLCQPPRGWQPGSGESRP